MNVQGLNEITKRQSIEKWALEKKIDVVMVQETRINDASKEDEPKHMWYFSTRTLFKHKDQVEKKRGNQSRMETSPGKPRGRSTGGKKNWSKTSKKSSQITGG